MKEEIKKLIEKAVLEVKKAQSWPDFEIPEISVDYPKSEQFGDFTSNIALILAKKVGESPMEIANQIAILLNCYIDEKNSCHSERNESDPRRMNAVEESREIMDGDTNSGILHCVQNDNEGEIRDDIEGVFEKIEVVAPGYLNFYLSKNYLQGVVEKINIEKEKFGNSQKKNEKVMVEFSQPNTHKEFHIGHLRNVFLGDALVKIIRKSGSEVVAANYIGDTGSHIAKCLWGIEKFHGSENIDEIENKAEFLGKVYTEASQAIEKNPEFEIEFKNVQKKLEAGDRGLVELWTKTKQWSLDEFQRIYKKMGTSFDTYFWESEEEIEGKEMLKDLMKVSCIKESQGAIIADLEEYGLGILVLVRSDGSALYGLKDIPLAVRKFKEFSIDRSVVVIDLRQSLYFKQIFKILECMGFDKKMQFFGYEFVSLKGSETMSSRKGNIIPATFLIEETIRKVKEKFPNTDEAEKIGISALKFYMLKYSSQTKIEYDIEESVKLDGATGPYVQYAHARISSILEKAQDTRYKIQDTSSQDLSLLVHEKELSLMKELNKFPALVEEISQSYEIHKLAHYAIKLADKFHSFYAVCRVIDQENPELTKARLSLANAVRIVLAETLSLIGVDAPEKM